MEGENTVKEFDVTKNPNEKDPTETGSHSEEQTDDVSDLPMNSKSATLQHTTERPVLNHLISEVNEDEDSISGGEKENVSENNVLVEDGQEKDTEDYPIPIHTNECFDSTPSSSQIENQEKKVSHDIETMDVKSIDEEISSTNGHHELQITDDNSIRPETPVQQNTTFSVPVQMIKDNGVSPMLVVANQHLVQHNGQMHASLSSMFTHQTVSDPTSQLRKKIILRLIEEQDATVNHDKRKGLFSRVSSFRPRSFSVGTTQDFGHEEMEMVSSPPKKTVTSIDRGEIQISWYHGTSAVELQDQVRRSVENKLRLGPNTMLMNIRILDDSGNSDGPYEEIVLSPFIPDGSRFILSFRVKDLTKRWNNRAPPSPSAAPSPPSEMEQLLQEQLNEVKHIRHTSLPTSLQVPLMNGNKEPIIPLKKKYDVSSTPEPPVFQDLLSQKLEKLNDTLLMLHSDGTWEKDHADAQSEKKQVVFMIANYFVLFLSIVAISAEIHERAPRWVAWVNENVSTVQNCATDKDTLFQCVSDGNFSGLLASIAIWASQSVRAKRLFLFGFDSTSKLWSAVYEAGVSALCWGFSYIFIRRGLNPDTRRDCLRKYWKDAVYGSLAGFNAAFLKAVLKNLMPHDQVLDVLETRQIRLVSFLKKVFK